MSFPVVPPPLRNDFCGIYVITANDQHYVGYSKDILTRWEQHLSQIENNTHLNPNLRNKKVEDISFQIIDCCSEEMLPVMEWIWFGAFNFELNIADPLPAPVGRMSDETRKKLSENQSLLSKEQREQVREMYATTDLGYKKIGEHFGVRKDVIRAIIKGVSHKDEHREIEPPEKTCLVAEVTSEETKREIVRLAKSGVSPTEIAECLGVSRTTVWKFTPKELRPNEKLRQQRHEIREFRKQNPHLNDRQVGETFGVPSRTVCKYRHN